jgi:gamma-glutamyl:cysteine ligase YbdK (ATP-grasp superfamily)
VRLVLPLLPALAASSPVVEGKITGLADSRMDFYRNNARRVPAVSGLVVPDAASSHDEYQERILRPVYEGLSPHDPEGILRHEWANARGCIARFDRSALEIRVLDVQETPRADLAVAALTTEVVRALVEERHLDRAGQDALATEGLAALLRRCIAEGEAATVDDPAYLAALGFDDGRPRRAGEVWRTLFEATDLDTGEFGPALRILLERGNLSRRIVQALGPAPSRARIEAVYRRLAACLAAGELFDPAHGI